MARPPPRKPPRPAPAPRPHAAPPQSNTPRAALQAPTGNYSVAMDHVAMAHKAAARVIRAASSAPVGMAHNVAYLSPAGVPDILFVWLSDRLVTFPWIDRIRAHIDFVGLNYYGQEFFAGAGQIAVLEAEEYSDSGRAIFPDGLYLLLKAFHKRYALPIIVTENGVADSGDHLRPAYLLEHLLAVGAARADGVPVAGYVFWTIADNWEWADGFCPKFGLAAVDRSRRGETASPRRGKNLPGSTLPAPAPGPGCRPLRAHSSVPPPPRSLPALPWSACCATRARRCSPTSCPPAASPVSSAWLCGAASRLRRPTARAATSAALWRAAPA